MSWNQPDYAQKPYAGQQQASGYPPQYAQQQQAAASAGGAQQQQQAGSAASSQRNGQAGGYEGGDMYAHHAAASGHGHSQDGYAGYYQQGAEHGFPTTPVLSGTSGSPRPGAGAAPAVDTKLERTAYANSPNTPSDRNSGRAAQSGAAPASAPAGNYSHQQQQQAAGYGQYQAPYGYAGYDYGHGASQSGAQPTSAGGWAGQQQHHGQQQRTVSGSSTGVPPAATATASGYHNVAQSGAQGGGVPNSAPPHAGGNPSSATSSGYSYPGHYGNAYGYNAMTGTVQPGYYSTNPAYLAQQANAANAANPNAHAGHQAQQQQHSAPASNAGINPTWPGQQGYDQAAAYYQQYGVRPIAQGQHQQHHQQQQVAGHGSVFAHGAAGAQAQATPMMAPPAGKKRPAEEEAPAEKGAKKGKKGKKEEAKEVDPNAPPAKSKLHPPRQSSSAWQIFFTDHLTEVKAKSGQEKINVATIAKEAGLIYSKMDQDAKKPFMERADEARKLYQVEYAAWLATLTPEDIRHENAFRAGQRKSGKSRKGNLKDMNAPKKPLSAYFLFLKAIRSSENLSDIVFGKETETTKQSMNAAMRWRSFTDDDKKPFLKQAEADKIEYDQMRKLYEEESARRATGEDVAARDYQPSYVTDPPSQDLLDAVLAPGDGKGMREGAAIDGALPDDIGDMTHDSEGHHSDDEHPTPALKSPDTAIAETPVDAAPAPQSAVESHEDPLAGMDALLDVPHDEDLPSLDTAMAGMPDFTLPGFEGDGSAHHVEESTFLVTGDDGVPHGISTKTEQIGDGPVTEETQTIGGGLTENPFLGVDTKVEELPAGETAKIEDVKPVEGKVEEPEAEAAKAEA